MTKRLIKICGISNPKTAYHAALLHADYIGIVFYQKSLRAVTKEAAIPIVKAIKDGGAKPVAVFFDEPFTVMKQICEETEIDIVQLHGPLSKKEHVFLPSYYQRIFAVSENKLSALSFEDLDSTRDFILIDSDTPGEGKAIDWEHYCYTLPFRWFLAGGLNHQNVAHAIQLLNPNGVDVSSGVESSKGQKDIKLIQQFISVVEETR